jgi:hypothetical protein
MTMLIAAMSMPLMAQSEGGLLLEAGAEKKINKKLSIECSFLNENFVDAVSFHFA